MTPTMHIFSVGCPPCPGVVRLRSCSSHHHEVPPEILLNYSCVIAELFLDGEPLFDLAGLMSYRKGEHAQCRARLAQIGDEGVMSLVSSMIQLDPWHRLSASEYLSTPEVARVV